MGWFGETKKGTVSSLIDKQQKEDLREFKREQARKNKLKKLRESREESAARGKKKSNTYFKFPIKKKKQGKKLSRKSGIRLI